jgi:hypothetical protein
MVSGFYALLGIRRNDGLGMNQPNVGWVSVLRVTHQELRSNTRYIYGVPDGTSGGLRRKQRASSTLH